MLITGEAEPRRQTQGINGIAFAARRVSAEAVLRRANRHSPRSMRAGPLVPDADQNDDHNEKRDETECNALAHRELLEWPPT